jgi:hypothetical protein
VTIFYLPRAIDLDVNYDDAEARQEGIDKSDEPKSGGYVLDHRLHG